MLGALHRPVPWRILGHLTPRWCKPSDRNSRLQHQNTRLRNVVEDFPTKPPECAKDVRQISPTRKSNSLHEDRGTNRETANAENARPSTKYNSQVSLFQKPRDHMFSLSVSLSLGSLGLNREIHAKEGLDSLVSLPIPSPCWSTPGQGP